MKFLSIKLKYDYALLKYDDALTLADMYKLINVDMKIEALQKKYPRFECLAFDWQLTEKGLKITFDFRIKPDIKFAPQVLIKAVTKRQIKRVGEWVLNNLVFNLGLIEALSYWKATCSPEFIVKAGTLDKKQIKWWQQVIKKGMAQYYFENQIKIHAPKLINPNVFNPPKNLPIHKNTPSPQFMSSSNTKEKNQILVPIGGGKDSIVSLEILKRRGDNVTPFALNPTVSQENILKTAELWDKTIVAQRTIDPKLLELNQRGFLNGHTPFTAYLSFLSVLVAALFGIKNIAFSNERSANQGNVKWQGAEINHQWSKTFEFEKMFRDYAKKYLVKNINYFSFLRPLYELQIARLFSFLPQYWPVFVSCNKAFKSELQNPNSKQNPKSKVQNWCCACPKCLSTFLMLAPFIDYPKLVKIFGQDMLAKKASRPTFLALLGIKGVKPFECVATEKEMLAAAYLTLRRLGVGDRSYLLNYFENKILPKLKDPAKETKQIRFGWDSKNFLPKNFRKTLANIIWSTIQAYAFFVDRMLILGMGREGELSLKIIRKYFPDKSVTIADQLPLDKLPKSIRAVIAKDKNLILRLGSNYLKALPRYQLIIKTPGIPWKIIQPYLRPEQIVTSQTELFFDDFPGLIIGITGTKGKSTTTALIYHILKKAGKKVLLLGNIGIPPLDYLPKLPRDLFPVISRKWVAVAELSSHHLYGLKKSPAIAVLLNIYLEHLDYYRDFKEYWQAKANIAWHQSINDFLVYNTKNKLVRTIAQKSRAVKIPMPTSKRYQVSHGSLHQETIAAALTVAKIFKISRTILKKALATFRPLPHRLERVGEWQGITFYNDSLATVPEATLKALRALRDGVQTLLLGGFDRGVDFQKLAEVLCASKVKNLIFFPGSGKRIFAAVQGKCPNRHKSFFVKNMAEAVRLAYKYTAPGKICLLSPASPSFGMFHDYQERGNLFKHYAKKFGRKA